MPCTISREQVLSPTLAAEVPNGLNADLCDFNVFAWGNFLYLVSPSTSEPSLRRFMVDADYPQYLGQGEDSCSATSTREFVVRDVAAPSPGPEAGTNSVVYSAPGSDASNLVLYNVRFSRGLCTETGPNLPSDLVEMKTAWRYLSTSDDASRYFTVEVDSDADAVLLGLIGFHLVQVAEDHPEMIWTTWEHVDNIPDCSDGGPAPSSGWTMTTSGCAACLAAPDGSDCISACTSTDATFTPSTSPLNRGWSLSGLSEVPETAQPTNVCRVFPQGTHQGDVEAGQNRFNIESLNAQVVGPRGYLAELPPTDPQSVWRNYEMIGGVWFNSDGTTPPGGSNPSLQRGSIRLANSVMETTFQGSFSTQSGSNPDGLNCFVCHQAADYDATLTSNLSHIAAYVNGGS